MEDNTVELVVLAVYLDDQIFGKHAISISPVS